MNDFAAEVNDTLTPISRFYATQKECIHESFIKTFYTYPSEIKRKLHSTCKEMITIALGSKQYQHNASTL